MEENNNFLFEIIENDLKNGAVEKVHTRFPPEPNGYLHIGHIKAVYINYTAAKQFGGEFNLRYDDTNPTKEDVEYVDSIYNDLKWLIGKDPDRVCYGSDYFGKCYEFAVKLIKEGKAYVCDLSEKEINEYRGTLTEPGRESPYRNRSVEENLALFEKMKSGVLPDGACTLRAKIDMSSPNINMRDPIIYRILHRAHHRQGDEWCIYPLYDFAHPIQDAMEGITHSMCSIEFENHRPLYDWVIDNIGFEKKPHQYEFAKLFITNTVLSKRNLKKLIDNGTADGWDDPRMPTVCGLRRRGYTPSALFDFVRRAGVAKNFSIVDCALLEHCIREELNESAPRRVCVLHPVRVVVDNYPEDKVEYFELPNNPKDGTAGTRSVAFTRELYIDSEDFSLDPPPKFFRLKPEGEVRLMGAYIVKFQKADLAPDGSVECVHVTADLESGCGNPADGRKVKGTIHWVSASECEDVTVNVYDYMFKIENTRAIPEGQTLDDYYNPDSKQTLEHCKAEKALASAEAGERFQFVRCGYFCKDTKNADTFNRIVELKDSKPF